LRDHRQSVATEIRSSALAEYCGRNSGCGRDNDKESGAAADGPTAAWIPDRDSYGHPHRLSQAAAQISVSAVDFGRAV
jgi:hypothetical protein